MQAKFYMHPTKKATLERVAYRKQTLLDYSTVPALVKNINAQVERSDRSPPLTKGDLGGMSIHCTSALP